MYARVALPAGCCRCGTQMTAMRAALHLRLVLRLLMCSALIACTAADAARTRIRQRAQSEAVPRPPPPEELWDGWHNWAVVVTSPGVGFGEIAVTTDTYRAAVLRYEPDYIDCEINALRLNGRPPGSEHPRAVASNSDVIALAGSAGATLNRARFTSNRGIPAAAPQQFESDWAFARLSFC